MRVNTQIRHAVFYKWACHVSWAVPNLFTDNQNSEFAFAVKYSWWHRTTWVGNTFRSRPAYPGAPVEYSTENTNKTYFACTNVFELWPRHQNLPPWLGYSTLKLVQIFSRFEPLWLVQAKEVSETMLFLVLLKEAWPLKQEHRVYGKIPFFLFTSHSEAPKTASAHLPRSFTNLDRSWSQASLDLEADLRFIGTWSHYRIKFSISGVSHMFNDSQEL